MGGIKKLLEEIFTEAACCSYRAGRLIKKSRNNFSRRFSTIKTMELILAVRGGRVEEVKDVPQKIFITRKIIHFGSPVKTVTWN